MVILGRFLTLFLLWPLFLGLRESWFTLALIVGWWFMLLMGFLKGLIFLGVLTTV